MVSKLITKLFSALLKSASFFSHFVILGARIWMANVFWKSGVIKISNWDTTIFLFTQEHPVPFLPPFFAALSGTAFELICPVLLTLGLATRLATLPLVVMTAVIQFTYLDNIQHYYWAFLLLLIFSFGPGKLSLDHLIKRKYWSEF